MHTILAFFRYSEKIKVILVLPEGDLETWRSLCVEYNFTKPLILQKGGDTRFQSVKNGLQKIDGDGLVAIHDGVRPLVSEDIIASSFRLAAVHSTAIAAVPLKESIRIIDGDKSGAVDRSKFRLIQTPQTFKISLIKKAYEVEEEISLTDDASVAEKGGYSIFLFEGSYENIKITTSEDFIIAEALMKVSSDE
jgi:2-C-methyl-D-erythritol 4-phosphate cytidylyltransferase